MKILYKFPSRQRPDKFFEALDNIKRLSDFECWEVLATLDEDDHYMNNDIVKKRLQEYPMVKAIYGTSTSKVNACNRDMDQAGEWDIVVLMSDDMKFLKKGFDRIIASN